MSNGKQALDHFNRAHPAVQEQFWSALRRDVEHEHEVCRAADALYGPPRKPRGFRPRTQWNDHWRRLDRLYKQAEQFGWSESDFEAQRERLRSIPTEDYVLALTGEEFTRGAMLCPLPGHDERSPSFKVRRDNRWRCFGCDRGDSLRPRRPPLGHRPARFVVP